MLGGPAGVHAPVQHGGHLLDHGHRHPQAGGQLRDRPRGRDRLGGAAQVVQHLGEERGCKEFRKHVSWYLKGFAAGGEMRRSLALISTLAELDRLLEGLDPQEPFPLSALGSPRGRQGSPRDKVVLPEGWLDDTDGRDFHVREDALEVTGG